MCTSAPPAPLSIVFSTFYSHFVSFSSLPPRDRACPPRRTPRGVGGLTGLRPLPPTPEKYVGLRSPPSSTRFFDQGLRSSASSPRASTRRVIQNAKSYLLPSPIATVVATCFDITSDMNCEVSFFASKIASQVTLGDRKDIESYPSSHFLGSKVGRNHRPRASGALPEPRGRNHRF